MKDKEFIVKEAGTDWLGNKEYKVTEKSSSGSGEAILLMIGICVLGILILMPSGILAFISYFFYLLFSLLLANQDSIKSHISLAAFFSLLSILSLFIYIVADFDFLGSFEWYDEKGNAQFPFEANLCWTGLTCYVVMFVHAYYKTYK